MGIMLMRWRIRVRVVRITGWRRIVRSRRSQLLGGRSRRRRRRLLRDRSRWFRPFCGRLPRTFPLLLFFLSLSFPSHGFAAPRVMEKYLLFSSMLLPHQARQCNRFRMEGKVRPERRSRLYPPKFVTPGDTVCRKGTRLACRLSKMLSRSFRSNLVPFFFPLGSR